MSKVLGFFSLMHWCQVQCREAGKWKERDSTVWNELEFNHMQPLGDRATMTPQAQLFTSHI